MSRSHVHLLSFLLVAGGAVATAAPSPSASPAPSLAAARAGQAAAGRTVVIDIDGEIDLGLAPFVQRVVASLGSDDLLILKINTFGGRIDAAVQIRDALLASKAKTVAFISPRAISAGALISLSTDTIVMTHGATIGAATPVQLEGGKMEPVEAKVVSYFRKEMKTTAEAKGRRGDIAEAMVDPSVVIPDLDGDKTTLTLTTAEALKWKYASFEAESIEAVCKRLNRPEPSGVKSELNWAERIARILSDSGISSLLMTFGMLGIMIELYAPGHAIAGAVGVTCLLLFFFGHYVVHLAGLEDIILFLVGAGLLVVELTMFPGHGALAILGILLILASLIKSLAGLKHVPFDVSWSLGWVPSALARVFGSILAAGVGMYAVSRFLPQTRLGRPLVLETAITSQGGQVGGDAAMIGRRGVAQTALRPTGKALIDGRRHDVVSEGGFIDGGAEVEVTQVEGTRIVVKKA